MAAEVMQLTDTQRTSFIMFVKENKNLVGRLSSFIFPLSYHAGCNRLLTERLGSVII